jgi:hypothetical protein
MEFHTNGCSIVQGFDEVNVMGLHYLSTKKKSGVCLSHAERRQQNYKYIQSLN